MADNTSLTPVFTAGQLPKKCYNDLQEFVNDLVNVIQFDFNAYVIAQGKEGNPGATGQTGGRGPAGPTGPAGPGSKQISDSVGIPSGATYVDVPIFAAYPFCSWNITSTSQVSAEGDVPVFDGDVFGVGQLVELYDVPVQYLRVFFVFPAGVASVPDDTFQLNYTYYEQA